LASGVNLFYRIASLISTSDLSSLSSAHVIVVIVFVICFSSLLLAIFVDMRLIEGNHFVLFFITHLYDIFWFLANESLPAQIDLTVVQGCRESNVELDE